MKFIATLFRVSPFQTQNLMANIDTKGLVKSDYGDLLSRVTVRYGQLAPRFKLFIQEGSISFAGMEAMTFDIKAENLPHAALVQFLDPLEPGDVARIDGGLRSELERLSIDQFQFKDHHWRMEVQVKGN